MNPAQTAGCSLILFGLTEFFMRRGRTARSLRQTAADQLTTPLLLASYALVAWLLMRPPATRWQLPLGIAWTGAGAAFGGLLLRWWAMLVLGKFYTRVLTTTDFQTVVTAGPYRYVRHPGYLGSLLTWTGAAAASTNAPLFLAIGVFLVAVYVRRIAAEERMLTATLGEAYRRYQADSWRLLPLIY